MPGLQRATYAPHRNACLHVSWAAAKSREPNERSPFDHRNATLINYFDTISLKALKISTGRLRGGFSPVSPLPYCPFWLILTSNRCRFEKIKKKKREKKKKRQAVLEEHIILEMTCTQITREPSVPQKFQQQPEKKKINSSKSKHSDLRYNKSIRVSSNKAFSRLLFSLSGWQGRFIPLALP